MILYPFPGDQAGHPLGGVKIRAVTCLECDGSGQKSFSADTVESTMPWQ
ncbi:MAG TPA: hypothetical protein VGR48_10285 [Terriglobales bacterium]|nr:hypothetical protein [Terriglobales bacterium]